MVYKVSLKKDWTPLRQRIPKITTVRLELEQNQLVGVSRQIFLGVDLLEGLQNGRFLKNGDAENL